MAAPTSRPVPQGLSTYAQQSVTNFQIKLQNDPTFKAFVDVYDNKITQLYISCTTSIEALKDPQKKDIAKKILNGSTQVIFSRPCYGVQLTVADVQRAPLDEQEFQDCVRDWTVRTIAYAQNYIANTPVNDVKNMLDSGDGVHTTITPATTARNCLGFVLHPQQLN